MNKMWYCAIPAVLFCVCTPVRRSNTYVAAAIPVVDERLSVSPIISEVATQNLPEWPTDPARQQILLQTFNDIWQRLQSEFRRCQKYGLYTMVEDNDNPTIRISVVITAIELHNDTLSMPIRLQAERLRDDTRFIYTLPATAVVPPRKRNRQPFYYYGQLLSRYAHTFPYGVLVSFFYEHKLD
jgi:hypothetical protein